MSPLDFGTTKTPAPAPKSSGWGVLAPIGHFFGSVARTTGRIFKDIGTLGGMLGHDVLSASSFLARDVASILPGVDRPKGAFQSELVIPLLKEIETRGKALPTDIHKLISGPHDVHSLAQEISGSLPGLLIPGVSTLGQLTSKAGRKELAEHPGFAVMDVLPIVGKFAPELKAAAGAIGDVATAGKIGQRAVAITAPLRSKVSLSAARKAAPLHTIGRTVHETVRSSLEEIFPKLKKLSDADYDQLQQMLRSGERPPVDHPLRDLYDLTEAHQTARATEGTVRTPPEEFKYLLKAKSLNHKPAGASQTYAEKLAEGLSGLRVGGRAITDDGAEAVMRQMTQAFMDDAPNPFAELPELRKVWSKINSHYKGQLRMAENNYGRLFQEPMTGGYYSQSEVSALRRKMSLPGRGVNLTNIGKEAADEVRMATEIRRYTQAGGEPSLNEFLKWKDADLRTRFPNATEGQIRATIEKYGRFVSKGALSEQTRSYVDAVRSMPPGNYQAFLDGFKRAQRRVLNQKLAVPGFGPAAARNAIEDLTESMNANILDLVSKGQRPVWLPRKAVAGEFEHVPELRLAKQAGVPGAYKSSQGLAAHYVDDMGYMMASSEAAEALQHTQLKVVSQLWADEGGWSHASARQFFEDRGFTRSEAESLLRKRFDSFDIDASGKVMTGPAREGSLLLPKEIAVHVKHMFDPPKYVGGMADKFLKYWMVPTLALAPAFHIGNILGGAIMTAARLPVKDPLTLMRSLKDAFDAAKTGRIIDPRIPTGRGFMPMLKDFMSPRDEAIAADIYGRGLAKAVEHWYGGPVKATNKVLELSERANQFFDELYRNFTALSRSPEFRTTGKLSEEGILAAKRLMQDYDSMVPFEREVIQRLIPFWTWKRTLVRWATTYPVDHPIRVTVLNQMARWHEEQKDVSDWLDDYLMNALPIGDKDAKGFQKYVSIRGMNPFSDFSNMATLKGWMSSAHPLIQGFAKFVGYDPFLGGVPAFAGKEDMTIDPQTGAHVRKLDPSAVADIIPQLRALQKFVNVPPPEEDSMSGWYGWWKKYGAALRLLPSLLWVNIQKEEAKHRELEGLVSKETAGAGRLGP